MENLKTDTTAFLPKKTQAVYRRGVRALLEADVPFLVGGAYALALYAGIERHTKDFDVFVRPSDAQRALDALSTAGFRTELTFPHWLGKAYSDEDFIDVIYSSGNGVAVVDDEWFDRSVAGNVLGMDLRLCPAEEVIWSKAFIDERERYDGADVAHILRSRGPELDWDRLLRRFGSRWRVLFSHLILFGFIYPGERDRIPRHVMSEFMDRLERELDQSPDDQQVCHGTLISREQYLVDIHEWGYQDARLAPDVQMTQEDIAHWTNAIQRGRADHP